MASDPASMESGLPTDARKARISEDFFLPSTYALPAVVKARLDGNHQLASAVAIVSTLFASAMMGMGQIIGTNGDDTPPWEAAKILTYASVVSNLAAAMCSLWVMALCADIPQKAQILAARDPESWPARVWGGADLPGKLIQADYELLTVFGMSKSYSSMEYGQLLWLFIGLVMMFAAIVAWSWVAQTKKTAGSILLFVIPALSYALYPVWSEFRHTRRERVEARKLEEEKAMRAAQEAKILTS